MNKFSFDLKESFYFSRAQFQILNLSYRFYWKSVHLMESLQHLLFKKILGFWQSSNLIALLNNLRLLDYWVQSESRITAKKKVPVYLASMLRKFHIVTQSLSRRRPLSYLRLVSHAALSHVTFGQAFFRLVRKTKLRIRQALKFNSYDLINW